MCNLKTCFSVISASNAFYFQFLSVCFTVGRPGFNFFLESYKRLKKKISLNMIDVIEICNRSYLRLVFIRRKLPA